MSYRTGSTTRQAGCRGVVRRCLALLGLLVLAGCMAPPAEVPGVAGLDSLEAQYAAAIADATVVKPARRLALRTITTAR
jgi:hypothetical protein